MRITRVKVVEGDTGLVKQSVVRWSHTECKFVAYWMSAVAATVCHYPMHGRFPWNVSTLEWYDIHFPNFVSKL